ncbi:MAG: hypothetical protein RL376_530 [Verrucomicrobiota bacterium]|jgi:hypothetical protein
MLVIGERQLKALNINHKQNPAMPTIHAPDDVRDQAKSIIKIFQTTADLKIKVDKKDFTAADLVTLEAEVKTADDLVEAKRAELTPLLNARNEKAARLNTVLVQARKVIAGYFGEDSDEYELVGGTRKSERKSPGRRSTAKPAKP